MNLAVADTSIHRLTPVVLRRYGIKIIRDHLHSSGLNGQIIGSSRIIKSYLNFQLKIPSIRKELSIDKNDETFADKTQLIERWLSLQP